MEGGIVRGEVFGLEVARIVHGTTSTGTPIAVPVIEVGVGHADREMTAMVHGGLPPIDQLHRVRAIVLEHRRPDALRHQLNQRAGALAALSAGARPGSDRLRRLRPTPPRCRARTCGIPPSRSPSEWMPQAMTVVAAFSVGVHLDLVPAAADARAALAPGARLLLVLPPVTPIR